MAARIACLRVAAASAASHQLFNAFLRPFEPLADACRLEQPVALDLVISVSSPRVKGTAR